MSASGGSTRAIVVPGEAPESDDENESQSQTQQESTDRALTASRTSTGTNDSGKSFYNNSVYHQKLHETNARLGQAVSTHFNKQAAQLVRELQQVANCITSTELTTQDTSYKSRELADKLYNVDRHLNVIFAAAECIPDFQKDNMTTK